MDKVHNIISETKAKVAIVSEANMLQDPEHFTQRELKFPNYKCEDKFFAGSTSARLTILVHEEVEYVREHPLENNINCAIVLKIKRKKKKWSSLIGVYRQWTGTAPGLFQFFQQRG